MDDDKKLDFLKKEYEVISNAHFNVSERVTSFFRYILLIYSAPLILFTDKVKVSSDIKPWIFIAIAITGLLIDLYLVQLRFESILYARTVNGMRRFFYEKIGLSYERLLEHNVLPIQKEKPSFYDTSQFIWIVSALSFINSLYFITGLFFLKPVYKWPSEDIWLNVRLLLLGVSSVAL